MSRYSERKLLLLNLERKIPEWRTRDFMNRERALELLREMTGQDFGYDGSSWRQWFRDDRNGKLAADEEAIGRKDRHSRRE